MIGCIDQSKEKEKYCFPDEKINRRRNVDLLSFRDVQEMAQEKTHYVALVSSPEDGKNLWSAQHPSNRVFLPVSSQ